MRDTETVSIYAVLGDAARRRSVRSLAMQSTWCGCVAVFVWRAWPTLWSIGALLLMGALYAAWGLLDRARVSRTAPQPIMRQLSLLLASAATGLAIVGVVGLGAAMFAGHGHSPYDACGPRATTAHCYALKNPVRVTHLP